MFWLSQNRGILSRLAEEFEVTQPFVSRVFYGEARSGELRIERRLAELGVPGFSVQKVA